MKSFSIPLHTVKVLIQGNETSVVAVFHVRRISCFHIISGPLNKHKLNINIGLK